MSATFQSVPGPQLQAICIAPDCILSVNDTCSAYASAVAPAVADTKLIGNYSKAANGTTSLNTTTGGSPPPVKAGAVRLKGANLWTFVSVSGGLLGLFTAGMV